MKIKIDDILLLAAYLDKHASGGEIELERNITDKGSQLTIYVNTSAGDRRTIVIYSADTYMWPKLISEDQLRVK